LYGCEVLSLAQKEEYWRWRWLTAGSLRRVVWQNFTDVSEVLAASIIRETMTHRSDDGGSIISETFVNFYQTTRRYDPEDSHLHTRRRENLKPHNIEGVWEQGTEDNQGTLGFRQLNNEEFQLIIKSKSMTWVGKPRCRWEDNIKMDLTETFLIVCAGFIWFRIGTSDRLLRTRWWSLGFNKRRGISFLAKYLLASQVGLCSVEFPD
jgi:hypothetical protein